MPKYIVGRTKDSYIYEEEGKFKIVKISEIDGEEDTRRS